MTAKTTEIVEFFGEAFIATIEYNFTKGYSAGWSDPGSDDEIDVLNIWLQRAGRANNPKFLLTHEAHWAVADQEWVLATCFADNAERQYMDEY